MVSWSANVNAKRKIAMTVQLSIYRAAPVVSGLILIGSIANMGLAKAQEIPAIPVETVEPIEVPTGNISDIQDVKLSPEAQSQWGQGGRYANDSRNNDIDYSYKRSADWPGLKIDDENNQYWPELNRGDIKPTDTVQSYPRLVF